MRADDLLPGHAPGLRRRPFIRQVWDDVVFLHWRADAAVLRPFMPAGCEPDVHDGSSWVGLIGFVLRDTEFPPLPPLRRLGTFVEINVRLYSVDARGRRGVVFLSLDAGRLLPVLAANAGLGLPYRWAHAERRESDGEVSYASRRHGRASARTRFGVRVGERIDEPSPLDVFLTARWGMHVHRFGRTTFWPNEHEPWPLHRATALPVSDGLITAAGLPDLASSPPESVLYAPRVSTAFAFDPSAPA